MQIQQVLETLSEQDSKQRSDRDSVSQTRQIATDPQRSLPCSPTHSDGIYPAVRREAQIINPVSPSDITHMVFDDTPQMEDEEFRKILERDEAGYYHRSNSAEVGKSVAGILVP